jgi:G3E family GTPase
VIENEFGEVGVDDALVKGKFKEDEEIFEMNNGCICCTVRGDLIRILKNLKKHSKKFDYVLIETTGLADPAPVAQTFFVDDDICASYELDGIITVIDSKHILQHLEEVKPDGVENESVEQVAFADRILINKIDLVTEEELKVLEGKIGSINKADPMIRTHNSEIDLDKILNIKAFDLKKITEMDPEFLTDQEHQHDLTVSSVGMRFEGPIDMGALNSFISELMQSKGVDLFRYKGILNIVGCPKKYVF